MKFKMIGLAAILASTSLAGAAIAQNDTSGTSGSGTSTQAPATMPDAGSDAVTPVPPASGETTGSTSPATNSIFVPPDSLANTSVLSASNLIGKRVYSRTGDDLGEVNDIFVTKNGDVEAVVVGVGGFLGIGEKDVALTMASIDMAQDGNDVRLVVDANAEQLNAAPSYDRAARAYRPATAPAQ